MVSFEEVFEDEKNFYITMELCETNLTKFLKSSKDGRFSDKKALAIFFDICNGFLDIVRLGFMHKYSFHCRDL